MARFSVSFYALTLSRAMHVEVLIPNDIVEEETRNNPHYKQKMKTLLLLHGHSGCEKDWMVGTDIESLSTKYNMAVVMPYGANSFYVDNEISTEKYATFLSEELPAYMKKTFNLFTDVKDTFIGGNSMGGYGALRTGLLHPDKFDKIFALSSALIQKEISKLEPGGKYKVGDYAYYSYVFGDLKKLLESDKNLEVIINKYLQEQKKIPDIYLACGKEDFVLENNRDFHAFLESKNVSTVYKEPAGGHDWFFWSQELGDAIQWLFSE